jgi:hypothetical protein
MDSQQITEFLPYGTGPKELLDRWKALREKTAALREERDADPKAWEERVAAMRSRRITVRPEEMNADTNVRLEEIAAMTDKIWAARREMMNASHKETVAEKKPETEVKTMASQEMEAHQEEEEPTSPDRKPEAAQKDEIPAEDAEVMPAGEPKKKRRRDRKLAAERRRQEPKDTKRINGGPQEKLAVARRETSHRATVARQNDKRSGKKMSRRATVARRTRDTFAPNLTRRAKVARRREHIIGNSQTWKNVARGTRRGRRLQVESEGSIGVKDEQISRGSQTRNWTLWRGRPTPKRKKKEAARTGGTGSRSTGFPSKNE